MQHRWLARTLTGFAVVVAASPFVGALAAVLPVPVEVAVTGPAPAQDPGPLPSTPVLEAQMFSRINAERAAAGVGPVRVQSWSQSVAELHSQQMAAAGDIWHNISAFISTARPILGAAFLGENVAMDSTLAAADQLLYSDPPHQAITLDARYNTVGVGIAVDANNWIYLTEDFAEIPGARAGAAPAPTPVAPVAAVTPKPAPRVAPVTPKPATSVAPVTPKPATVTVVAPMAPAQPAAATPAPAGAVTPAPTAAVDARPVSTAGHGNPLPIMAPIVGAMMVVASAGLLGRLATLLATGPGRWTSRRRREPGPTSHPGAKPWTRPASAPVSKKSR